MDQSQLNERLDEIKKVFGLLDGKSDKRSILVRYKLQYELDMLIDSLEEIYYKYYLKNRPIDKLENETAQLIASSRQTMDAFLPYMIMYNTTNLN